MNPPSPRRRLIRGAAAAVATTIAAAGIAVSVPGADASVRPPGGAGATAKRPAAVPVLNPYSPAYHHAYRHGVVPARPQQAKMRRWVRSHPRAAAPATSASDLNYGGGIDGTGVTTGHEKVYLVFWGSQWGTESTDGNGDLTFAYDNAELPEAAYLQEFFKGLGTDRELWSGVMTQYCQGVAAGAQSCPAGNTQHVAYPANGVLAGAWADESDFELSPTGHEIGAEAVKAAAHFGNTTAASNRDAQYVIVSAPGADPDNWSEDGYCAWHDDTGDANLDGGGAVPSSYGDLAFTNLPYVDGVPACGAEFVNLYDTQDAVSIVEGHEYAETITDQNPAGGWTDSSGEEAADKCAWITPGTAGGAFDLKTSTGTYAMQTIWANDGSSGNGACERSHPIVMNPGQTLVFVGNPGPKVNAIDTSANLQLHSTDSAPGQTFTYTATGLPAGLSISSAGLITGTATTVGQSTVTVTAKDTAGASGTISFLWTVTTPGSGCTAAQLLIDPGFETIDGPYAWTGNDASIYDGIDASDPHSGTWDYLLEASTAPQTNTLAQSVTLSAACKTAKFSFWLHIESANSSGKAQDTVKVQVLDDFGHVLATLGTFSNLNVNTGYTQHFFNLARFIGMPVTVQFTATQQSSSMTSFLIDDTALKVN